uniref:Phosphate transporter n=1 Tax=Coccidioides posadasii RMSCC 3488 TaxID=454284 RepID=A0A0J6FHU4_COCPO|nr:sodium-dependent phosphate transporter 1-A [Coccidioides posadasii RMSCC 3488]
MAVLEKYDWIIAIISIAFCASSFGNGANDVANSYATSVAARTLTMPQSSSAPSPSALASPRPSRTASSTSTASIPLQLPSSSAWAALRSAAPSGSSLPPPWASLSPPPRPSSAPSSASASPLRPPSNGEWTSGSVSQVAASWGIAPAIAAGFSAIIFATIKYSVHNRSDSLKWALRMIPFYLAFTAAILALFIIVEIPNGQSFEEFGVGKMCGIIFGVFFGCLAIAYTFFLPYFHRRLVKEDARLRARHIPLGPLLWKDDPWIYWPAPADGDCVIDYYESSHNRTADSPDDLKKENGGDSSDAANVEKGPVGPAQSPLAAKQHLEPDERFLAPYRHLPIFHPLRLWSFVKYFLLQGVTRDCVTHDSDRLAATHARAARYDNRVEHLWTYAQVASAMVMSIAHGSNDVANAVGPWVAAYETYRAGIVQTKTDTPIWILVIAGFLLGAGFWFFGFHIIRALGNRITQMSPTRGFSMELGAAITVLLASRLGLPVSTTQCLTGATVGTALMNYDLGAVNWRQLLWIFGGWVLTLPCAGLVSGVLMLMALNTPHF